MLGFEDNSGTISCYDSKCFRKIIIVIPGSMAFPLAGAHTEQSHGTECTSGNILMHESPLFAAVSKTLLTARTFEWVRGLVRTSFVG